MTKIWGIWGIVGVMGVYACTGTTIEVGPGSDGANPLSGMAGTPGAAGGGQGSGPLTQDPNPNGTCTDTDPLPVFPSTTACAGTNDLPVVGKWHGYIETQDAPWDELLLDIKAANSGGLCGTLTIGSGTPPAPATDPEQAYPPGTTPVAGLKITPGYALTLLDGKADGTRIRFRVAPSEAFQSWCELQTPYQHSVGACSCAPSGPIKFDAAGDEFTINDDVAGVTRTFPSAQAHLCGVTGSWSVCACNTYGCGAANNTADTASVKFDLTVSGDAIEGVDTAHSNVRTHFTRVP